MLLDHLMCSMAGYSMTHAVKCEYIKIIQVEQVKYPAILHIKLSNIFSYHPLVSLNKKMNVTFPI